MKRTLTSTLFVLLMVMTLCSPADARGQRRRKAPEVQVARLQLRTARANSGRPVAWGFYYSAKTASNLTGLPGMLLGVILR